MKKLFLFVLLLLLIGVGGPGLAYWLGLQNTHGRPAPPQISYTDIEASRAWLERRESLPVSLRTTTPWHWYELLWCSRNDERPEDFLTCGDRYPGLRASGFVAREYLAGRLDREGLLWRYLSRTAITIWITRNWSEQDLMAELVRLRRLGR